MQINKENVNSSQNTKYESYFKKHAISIYKGKPIDLLWNESRLSGFLPVVWQNYLKPRSLLVSQNQIERAAKALTVSLTIYSCIIFFLLFSVFSKTNCHQAMCYMYINHNQTMFCNLNLRTNSQTKKQKHSHL